MANNNDQGTGANAPVKVRVLVQCAAGKPNDVATVTPAEAEAGLQAGELDSSPEGVAYAESLATA